MEFRNVEMAFTLGLTFRHGGHSRDGIFIMDNVNFFLRARDFQGEGLGERGSGMRYRPCDGAEKAGLNKGRFTHIADAFPSSGKSACDGFRPSYWSAVHLGIRESMKIEC